VSFFDDLVSAAAGILQRIFGNGASAPLDTADARSTPPSSVEVVQAGSVAPAVPEAPAGAGYPDVFMLPLPALGQIMPHQREGVLAAYLPYLTGAMVEFAIDTRLRAAAFLAQLAHESAELREWTENLNYSAAALLATFPTHFDAETAAAYARQPERIANRVYANRMGNGPEESGDGWRYRGRGPIELTGLDGYRGMGAALGVDLVGNPDLAATPRVGFRIAGRYWATHDCNRLADSADQAWAFQAITRAINGGLNGLASREAYYAKAREALEC